MHVLGGVRLARLILLLLPSTVRSGSCSLLRPGVHLHHRLAPPEGVFHHFRPPDNNPACYSSSGVQLLHVHRPIPTGKGDVREVHGLQFQTGSVFPEFLCRSCVRGVLVSLVYVTVSRSCDRKFGSGLRTHISAQTPLLLHVARRRELVLEVPAVCSSGS